jgi:diacylglycerol kinase (ATP)
VGKRNHRGLSRIFFALSFAIQGLRAAWRHEPAFRQEVAGVLIAAPLGGWLGRTGVERALLIGSLLLVLIVELLNSAVEAVVDRVGDEEHPLSGRAKDMGAAAVLVSLLFAAMVWVFVIFDRG